MPLEKLNRPGQSKFLTSHCWACYELCSYCVCAPTQAWPVWGWLRDTVDAFKRTMPLITDLRNPAMRERHWSQLMVGTC
jgi:hypothetical protein